MFDQRTGLLFESDGWPRAFQPERRRQPIQLHEGIVQAAQIDVGGNSAHLQNLQACFTFGLNDDLCQQRVNALSLAAVFQQWWLAPRLVFVNASMACCRVRVVMPLSLPAKYAVAIWRFNTGGRSELFLASMIY